ncbi:MAG: DUF2723 domain-containing protein [Calditrichaeota bacterium]|nr:DUF2723 domain-containing protein [Calditrichota bacterium]MCB9368405.1 DUF2723 domain-containing protein [Calditrichota bacterium]
MRFDTKWWFAAAVFAISLVVYSLTMAESVSFWDCGEFAACSYTLSVPHPPGSPLFLLVGRIFSMIPISPDIAVRVTWMSVLSSAFAILLAFLIIVRMIRMYRGREESEIDKLIVYGGAFIGSLSLAFSYSMWFNAVESEVYAMSQLLTHLVVWLILVWYEKADEPGNERWLLLIGYVIGLATGVHLLMILAIPALALVIYFRRREFELKSFAALIIGTGIVFIMVYPGVVKWLPAMASKFGSLAAPFILVIVLAGVFWWAASNRHGVIGTAVAGLLLVIIGYSAYTMIYIRSGLNPPIDENDPETPSAFLSYLNREQYGDRAMFPRMWKGNPAYSSEWDYFWDYQINKMFNRYLLWQFVGRDGAPEAEYQDAGVAPTYSIVGLLTANPTGILRWLAILTCAPLLLGFWGFFHQYSRDRTGWLITATIFFMMGYAIILYLNQDDPQPRERDYSYVGAFFAFAMWIGFGASAALDWISSKAKESKGVVAGALAILIILTPGMLLARNYTMNDRSGNDVAWDYSYNMLMSCAPNGIIFTNGDNDTFPVWYLQEVEGVRKDVRLVNLSLLNTGWYIKQLRDREPKVPLSFNDAYIDTYVDGQDARAILSRYWPADKHKIELNTPEGRMSWDVPGAVYIPYKQGEPRDPNFLRVQDQMILDILRTNYDRSKTPTPKSIYFAVTVANSNMVGLRDFLTMEGLVFKITPGGSLGIDAEMIKKNIFENFAGHFRGINDPGVHFDDNVSKLLQNYRSMFLQLAYYYRSQPDAPGFQPQSYSTLDEQWANFDKLSNRDKALTLMRKMDQLIPEEIRPISNVELSLQIGRMFSDLGDNDELKKRLDWAEQRTDVSVDAKLRIAATYAGQMKDTVRASQIIKSAIGETPTAEQLYTAGTTMYQSEAYGQAAEYFERIMEMDPRNGQAIGGLLQCYDRLGQTAKSVALLENWVAMTPNDINAKRRLEDLRGRLAVKDSNNADTTASNN